MCHTPLIKTLRFHKNTKPAADWLHKQTDNTVAFAYFKKQAKRPLRLNATPLITHHEGKRRKVGQKIAMKEKSRKVSLVFVFNLVMQHGAWPPIVSPGQGLFAVFRQLHLMKFYK